MTIMIRPHFPRKEAGKMWRLYGQEGIYESRNIPIIEKTGGHLRRPIVVC